MTGISANTAWLYRAERIMRRLLEIMMVLSGLGLGILMFAQVVLRELDSAFLGFEEAAILLGLWIYFLGFSYATWNQTQISGGLETLILKSEKSKHRHAVIINLASFCFLVFILFQTWDYFVFTSGNGRVSTYLRWPRGLWAGSLLAGVGISCLAQFVHTVLSLKHLQKG